MGTAIATEAPRVTPSMESVSYLAVEAHDTAYNPDRTSGGTVVARLEHFHDSGLTTLRLAANGHVFREASQSAGVETSVRLVLASRDAVRALTCCLLELLQNEKAIDLLEAVAPDDYSG